MKFASWSAWRLLAIWVGWTLVVALGILAVLAICLWRARVPPTAGTRFSSDLALVITPGLRVGIALLFLPPLLLTLLWLRARLPSDPSA